MLRHLCLVSVICLQLILFGCGRSNSSSVGSTSGSSVSLTGAVTTIDGMQGSINAPFGITTDGTNLYVADYRNSVIKKVVIATGELSTLGGVASNLVAPVGITTDGTNLYITDAGARSIMKMVIATGKVTKLTGYTAGFNFPYGIATDGTNLYVADTGNSTIRKVVIASGEVSTLAGTAGVAGNNDGIGIGASFSGPYGITTDNTNLYVADTGNNTIRKIVIATGVVTTLAGTTGTAGHTDGTGTAAGFSGPYGITTDGTNLYVADTGNSTIRKVVIATGEVSTLAGTAGVVGNTDETGTAASFSGPYGIILKGTSLFVTDTGNNTIRMIQ